ncbi:MAG: hypothetical protein ABW321_29515, partial [Polyangiales bacterium]
SRAGCRAPVAQTPQGDTALARQADGVLSEASLRAARVWLQSAHSALPATSAPTEERSVWQRWYVWSALSVVVIGAAVSVAVAAWPPPQRTLRVTVDPTALR